MYADFEFYTDCFGGTLDQSSFKRYAMDASEYLDYITGGKAAKVTDEATLRKLRRACCKLIEAYADSANTTSAANGNIASETVGSYSVSYRSPSETESERKSKLADICRMALAGTGLLYRGIDVHSTRCNCL